MFHDDAFSKVNYSEPIFYPPPRLNHKPFKFTKKTRKLAQAKETQKQYYVSRFNNLMKPKMHFQAMDIGVRIETLFSDRIKELCNGKVCYVHIQGKFQTNFINLGLRRNG